MKENIKIYLILLAIFISIALIIGACSSDGSSSSSSSSSGSSSDKKCVICGKKATHGSYCSKHFDSFADWHDDYYNDD